MRIKVELSEKDWNLLLQTIYHRRLQTSNPKLKADLQEMETRLELANIK